MPIFKVIITYPNSSVEEIDEEFAHLDDAIAYADRILAEIPFNAPYHNDILDEEGDAKNIVPYAIVTEKEDGESRIVYDSRKK